MAAQRNGKTYNWERKRNQIEDHVGLVMLTWKSLGDVITMRRMSFSIMGERKEKQPERGGTTQCKSLQWLRQGVREDMYEHGGRVDTKGSIHGTV